MKLAAAQTSLQTRDSNKIELTDRAFQSQANFETRDLKDYDQGNLLPIQQFHIKHEIHLS